MGKMTPGEEHPSKHAVREIEGLSEKIERGVGSVFATAYRIGRRSLPR
jgi:hypothetical protein